MKRLSKVSAIILSIFLICFICAFVGCDKNNEEKSKYDVAVMIVRRETTQQYPTEERWFVDADEVVVDIEQVYDGKSYVYYVYAYNLPDHPEFGDVWFLYNQKSSSIGFVHNQFERQENGRLYVYSSVRDKGEYKMAVYASKESQLWNGKRIELHITIK